MTKDSKHFYVSKAMFLGTFMFQASIGMVFANSSTDTFGSTEPNLVAASPQQTTYTIKGVVEDALGPIAGANVVEKGTTNGTITDMDGNFTLEVSSHSILVISYIGYKDQEIPVNNQTSFSIKLVEDSQALDEVVVVGYGTQKKVNLSGSVSAVNVEELTESRPITNVSHVLAGMAAGVNVSASSNQPGNDDAAIKVRGQGTLNDSSPLVIIDGVEASINSVNPQDIEAMSVLKDAASSAIYGSRAANGVILITTKQGKAGTVKLDYNGYVSFESTNIPSAINPVSDYATYMELMNEGYSNSNVKTYFSQAKIDEWRKAGNSDPVKYPNTNWIDETFRPATATNHVLSMSGGSEKIRFYSSFGYQNNPGVMENTGFEKYNGRVNVSADVKPWLNLAAQVSGYVSNMDPAGKYTDKGTVVDNVFDVAGSTTPGMILRAPDGRFGAMNNSEDDAQAANNNPLVRLHRQAGKIRKTNLRSRFVGTLKPFEGFSLTASYSYEFTDEQRSLKPVFIDQWNFYDNLVTWTNKGKTSLTNYNGKTERFFGDIVARYEKRFIDDHLGMTAMVGASQELYRTGNFSATKYDMIDLGLNVLDAAIGDASASGSSSEWAMRSFFGRVNLDWDNKYLLELNLRSDASSRFLSGNRTGYFPSGSFAWRMDQESFMEDLVEKGLSNLKVRVSYGTLGNNSVGNYDAIATYANKNSDNIYYNYVLNNAVSMGLAQALIANPNLTWESTAIANVGVDFGLVNNKLTGTIEYFNKKTKDILIDLPAPLAHGSASIPKQNSATVTNQGLELSLGWNDHIGNFSYGISGNFTYVKNMVNKFKGSEPSIDGAKYICEGYSINSQYLLQVDRIIQTDEDMAIVQDMVAKNPNAFSAFGMPQKGDFLYKDIDKNGIIDNKDRSVVSDGPNPKYMFGLNLNAAWKGFDLSVLFQGQAGAKEFWMRNGYNTSVVLYGNQINQEVADGRWYEGRTDATYPRLATTTNKVNTQNSDFYLQNKAFLKVRNIQLGYTLPKAWMDKIQIERIRIYGSLENFFTFTSYKGLDPEVSGLGYPTMKQATIGLNVTF
ncbi:MAG: TonB-dependent receptor [Parabacteroides johnsonii]|nr:TonB-dependent receptor [Parabacteroides johnsonii]